MKPGSQDRLQIHIEDIKPRARAQNQHKTSSTSSNNYLLSEILHRIALDAPLNIMTGDVKHALIFGASGISGWSLLNQCLSYPSATTFRRVTGLCNRPLAKEESFLPDDSRLRIVPGIDLTASVDIVIEQLKTKVEEVEMVDVVFFCGRLGMAPSGLSPYQHITLTSMPPAQHTSKPATPSP